MLADWLKVRGTLKSWTKLWCVLKPGLLLIYKTPKVKSSHWVGTVLLTSCQVIERPSKKDGFCFKLFHPLDQSIWAPRGPEKETMGAVVQPLPTSYLIFRAPSQAAGKCWMDALELSLRCSALLVRSVSLNQADEVQNESAASGTSSHETQWSEADYEKHFDEHGELSTVAIFNMMNFIFFALCETIFMIFPFRTIFYFFVFPPQKTKLKQKATLCHPCLSLLDRRLARSSFPTPPVHRRLPSFKRSTWLWRTSTDYRRMSCSCCRNPTSRDYYRDAIHLRASPVTITRRRL